MRTNMEYPTIMGSRQLATRRASVTMIMTGTFVIPNDAPEIYLLDCGGVSRSVRLPLLSREFTVVIANIGSSGVLTVTNSAGAVQTTLKTGEVKVFYAGATRWVWSGDEATHLINELPQITAAGAVPVLPTDDGYIINKAVASPTPLVLPDINLRGGKPLRFVDWNNTTSAANPATLVPFGSQKVMNQSSYILEGLGYSGIMLFPNIALNGWTLGA